MQNLEEIEIIEEYIHGECGRQEYELPCAVPVDSTILLVSTDTLKSQTSLIF